MSDNKTKHPKTTDARMRLLCAAQEATTEDGTFTQGALKKCYETALGRGVTPQAISLAMANAQERGDVKLVREGQRSKKGGFRFYELTDEGRTLYRHYKELEDVKAVGTGTADGDMRTEVLPQEDAPESPRASSDVIATGY